jgi:hypothetical protein
MLLTNIVKQTTKEIKILPGFDSGIILSYNLISLSNGNYSSIDRGSTCDKYKCTIKTKGDKDYIDSIVEFIQIAREDGYRFKLSSFNDSETIFGANVDYSDPIVVAILDMGMINQKKLNRYELEITFEINDTSLLTFNGEGSLPVLNCLGPKYTSDTTWNYNTGTSYQQIHYISDHISDAGYFKGKFTLTRSEMLELREFYRQQRGEVFQLTTSLIKGVDNLFGTRGTSFPVNVRIKKIKETYKSVNLYYVNIEFYEEVN